MPHLGVWTCVAPQDLAYVASMDAGFAGPCGHSGHRLCRPTWPLWTQTLQAWISELRPPLAVELMQWQQ